KNYIYAMYKDKAVATAADYSVVDVAMIKMVPYPVVWTADVKSGAADAVQIVPGDNHKVTIDVNEKTPVEVAYTLTATLTAPDGKTMSVSFEHTIPAFKELTWNEYAASAKGDTIVAKGVITGIMAKSKGNSTNCLYMQDSVGGYYVYGLATDPVEDGLKIGQTVRVTGTMDIYSGTYEIASATVEVLDEGTTEVTPADWTAKYEAATSLKDAELVKEQALLVTVKGVEITGQDTASGYYRFKKNGLESYVRISSSVCPIVKNDQTKLIADHAAHLGWTADVTGVICVYDGAFYLSPVSADAFQYVSLPAKSDREMVAFELDNIAVAEAVTEDTVLALPTVGAGYSQVSLSWASDNACAVVDGGKVSFTLPEEDTVVTLTAT
ncbi:MAG: hypothetical protein KBS81_01980, partial [Spirochaetales bacterium]|nr:hypothetical protein [Candidatus Physcosoma equi]